MQISTIACDSCLLQTVSDMKQAMNQTAFAQEIAILRACRNANVLQFQVLIHC
jgi:hypothetical protein